MRLITHRGTLPSAIELMGMFISSDLVDSVTVEKDFTIKAFSNEGDEIVAVEGSTVFMDLDGSIHGFNKTEIQFIRDNTRDKPTKFEVPAALKNIGYPPMITSTNINPCEEFLLDGERLPIQRYPQAIEFTEGEIK